MNTYILQQINEFQSKGAAYNALLGLRYSNLCVKSDYASLLPVNVYIDGMEVNLEEVANVNQPSEFQLGVFPKNPDNMNDIIDGIYEAHPEFKMEIKSIDGSREKEKAFVLYTMPEVDKNRRKMLNDAVETLYEECKGKLELIYGEYQAKLATAAVNAKKKDIDDTNKALDDAYEALKKQAKGMLEQKQKDIEEGYLRYLEQHEEAGDDGANAGHSFRISDYQ